MYRTIRKNINIKLLNQYKVKDRKKKKLKGTVLIVVVETGQCFLRFQNIFMEQT
jgi:hypothetical protein